MILNTQKTVEKNSFQPLTIVTNCSKFSLIYRHFLRLIIIMANISMLCLFNVFKPKSMLFIYIIDDNVKEYKKVYFLFIFWKNKSINLTINLFGNFDFFCTLCTLYTQDKILKSCGNQIYLQFINILSRSFQIGIFWSIYWWILVSKTFNLAKF